ncbi:carbamoyltransferase [Candidatus Woesearchaeota archaeon]|nr:carbamoyltransferase [Candidatus Woesearchaeota archaeon]
MYILGISCFYHDAAACLIKNNDIIAAVEEERFTRKKHDNSFPINSIKYCLEEAKIDINDIEYIGFYEKPILKFDRLISTYIDTFPKSYWSFCKAMPSWLTEKLRIPTLIRKKLKYNGKIIFIKHHMSHAASTFLVSPFKEAAILTLDAVGEWTTTSYGYGKNNEIKLLKEINFPDSLGLFYSTITSFLGFKVNNDEYKIMGLASYGKPIYYNRLKKLIDINEDGSYRLNRDYFAYSYKLKMFNEKLEKEFWKSRIPESKIEQKHKDLAASLQKLLEDIIIKISDYVYEQTKLDKLCIGGGIALNCVANTEILKRTKFKEIFIQPAAGDSGGALGVAYYIYNVILKNKRKTIEHVYLGPSFSNTEIRDFLINNNIKFEELEEKELLKRVARLINNNRIIGWFQGRMEFGPRALGNRSILANPTNKDMKYRLNNKVKHREDFRPFAPTALKEEVHHYFNIKQYDPFMTLVCDVKSKKIPAVTHFDNTARLQTIEERYNPKFYNLIKEFKKISKIPILINTSFNVRGEPIVCSPKNAYNCFINTGIDVLVMDNFLIEKINK